MNPKNSKLLPRLCVLTHGCHHKNKHGVTACGCEVSWRLNDIQFWNHQWKAAVVFFCESNDSHCFEKKIVQQAAGEGGLSGRGVLGGDSH